MQYFTFRNPQNTQILSLIELELLALTCKHAEWLNSVNGKMSHQPIIQNIKAGSKVKKVHFDTISQMSIMASLQTLLTWVKYYPCGPKAASVRSFSSAPYHVTACVHWNLRGHCIIVAGMQVDSSHVKGPSTATHLKALNLNVWWHNKVGCPVCATSTGLTEVRLLPTGIHTNENDAA